MNYIIDVQGYNKSRIDKNGDEKLDDCAVIRVHADSDKEALDKAEKLIEKKYYRVSIITETHEEINQEMQMAQMELQAKLLKNLK